MSRAGRGQILVVVDDEELRQLAGALMETTDAEVVEVETAVEALDHMQRCGHLVNVVFCDFRSDRGGRDLAREMRMRWPGVSRILPQHHGPGRGLAAAAGRDDAREGLARARPPEGRRCLRARLNGEGARATAGEARAHLSERHL